MCEGGSDFTRLVPQASGNVPGVWGFDLGRLLLGDSPKDELLGLTLHSQAALLG